MDKLSEKFLKDYLSTHTYGAGADYDFDFLYKLYADLFVKSRQDLVESPKKFRDFVLANTHLITFDSHLDGDKILNSLMQFTNTLDGKIRSAFRIANSEFADMVKKLAPHGTKSLLDVGSGEIPATSIFFAEKFQDVTSMDYSIIFKQKTLKPLKVELRKEYFSESTDVSKFDFVVAKYPCSAIIPIVKACTRDGKPYLIKLCAHDVPSKVPGYREDWREGWRETLPEFDDQIKFYDEYAYHIDLPEDEVKKIIDEHEARIPPVQKQSIGKRNPTSFSFSNATISKWFLATDEKPNDRSFD